MQRLLQETRFGLSVHETGEIQRPVEICKLVMSHPFLDHSEKQLDWYYLRDAKTKVSLSDQLYTRFQAEELSTNPQLVKNIGVPLIEAKKRKKKEEDLEEKWERDGSRFTTRDMDLKNISRNELIKMAEFCTADLKGVAMEHFSEIMSGSMEQRIVFILETSDSDKVVGFAVYSLDMRSPTNHTRLKRILDDNNWWPEKGHKDQWEGMILSLIQANGLESDQIEEDTIADPSDPDHPYHQKYLDVFSSLNHSLLLGEAALKDKLKDISRWIVYTRQEESFEDKGEKIDYAELYLHLVCADPDRARFGILKGVLRYLLRATVVKAEELKCDEAYIKLIPVNSAKAAMYEALGFEQEEDSSVMYSPDLLSEDVLLDIGEKRARSKKGGKR